MMFSNHRFVLVASLVVLSMRSLPYSLAEEELEEGSNHLRAWMDSFSSLASVVDAAASAVVSNHRRVDFEVRGSFDLPSDDDMTDEELKFTNDCLVSTYNDLHQPQDLHMDTVELTQHFNVPHDTKTAVMVRGSRHSQRWVDFTYILFWQVSVSCQLCALQDQQQVMGVPSASKGGLAIPMLTKTEQERWEDEFCDKLQAGPFEKFHVINSCSIAVYRDD